MQMICTINTNRICCPESELCLLHRLSQFPMILSKSQQTSQQRCPSYQLDHDTVSHMSSHFNKFINNNINAM